MARSVHVVPHTHWDREWYDPYPTFRLRLVDLLDELLPRLEADAGFAHFQLDGQMAVVDDYLEVRPEEADRLRRLSGEGRLSMGPWYVLPDEFLVSGETLVRDLQLGIATAERFGGAMEVGYLPDMFGHIAAMPQLLQLFGMDHAVVWRGVPLSIDTPAFWWQSPDGSRVRAEYLSAGYGNGSDMPSDAATLGERIDIFAAIQGTLVGERLLWMAGMDHEVPPAHLSRVVAELDAAADGDDPDSGYSLQVGSLADYLATAPTEGLPTHVGELRSGARANLLMGVASNRVDVKVAAAQAERLLERTAEPLIAFWSPSPARQQPLLDLAWLEVIRNAAHDSICACSHDEVVDAVLHRYAEASRTASGLAERALTSAAARCEQPGVHLFNSGARARRSVVELDVPGPFGDDPVEHPALQVLEVRPAQQELYRSGAAEAAIVVAREMIFEHPETRGVQLIDSVEPNGTPLLSVHLLPTTEPGAQGPNDAPTISTTDALGEVGRRCAEDPDLVVSTVLHRAEPSRRSLTLSPTVPSFGWARWEPTVPTQPVRAHGALGLTNGLVAIEVDAANGTFSVDGVAGYGRLVDVGDAGDTYNWCPPEDDLVVDAPSSVRVQVTEIGPVRGRIVVDSTYLLPELAEERPDGTYRRSGQVDQPVRTTIELHADDGVVRVHTELVNRARDHRLRVHLPLPRRATRSVAECAYGVVERPLSAEGGPNEWGVPTYPSRRFVQTGELSVTHVGLCEYELVDLDGPAGSPSTTAGELALTLVRATGWLSRGPMPSRPLPAGPEDRLEGAQVLKPLSLSYALCVGPASPSDANALAEHVWTPLHAVFADGGGDLGPTGSWLTVHGAEVDAVLTDADGALVVRVHEMDGVEGVLEVPGRTGQVVDLRSRVLGTFDGSMPLRPHQIVTLRLDPA
jgi:hypothetical protein